MQQSNQTIFYLIEKAIKEYRKLCLRNIKEKIPDLTVDQTMLIFMIKDQPELNQKEMAITLFKDNASITRMIELMVKKEYLIRSSNLSDRRQFNLALTEKAEQAIIKLKPVIENNRNIASENISEKEIANLKITLKKVIQNTTNNHQSKNE